MSLQTMTQWLIKVSRYPRIGLQRDGKHIAHFGDIIRLDTRNILNRIRKSKKIISFLRPRTEPRLIPILNMIPRAVRLCISVVLNI